ncbi:hypothetical protein QUF56_17365 [Ureibacillus composti]|nr:hypothetical protein [Ureibacillus composti]
MAVFSRATVYETLKILEQMSTTTDLQSFFFKYGIDNHLNMNSKGAIILSAAKYIVDNPDFKGILGGDLSYEIVEEIINRILDNDYYYEKETGQFLTSPNLKNLFLLDGYVIQNDKLVRNINTVVEEVELRDKLTLLLDKYLFTTAKGHYEQAISSFTRGDWAACNAQLRTYVESLFNDIAKSLTGNDYDSSNNARQALATEASKVFYPEYNEWLDGGKGYIQGFWQRLHTEGSHPGLSNAEDANFRLGIVQFTTFEILKRFDDLNQ